jgi:hypothetical protein
VLVLNFGIGFHVEDLTRLKNATTMTILYVSTGANKIAAVEVDEIGNLVKMV